MRVSFDGIKRMKPARGRYRAGQPCLEEAAARPVQGRAMNCMQGPDPDSGETDRPTAHQGATKPDSWGGKGGQKKKGTDFKSVPFEPSGGLIAQPVS
jgi:hypothetical protein